MKQGKRRSELDVLRGVGIFGVLILHSSFEGRFTGETLAVQATLARFFDWAVLAFFFSSGLLQEITEPLMVLFKKRVVSLLVPFIFYNALYNLCFVVTSAMGWGRATSLVVNSQWSAIFLFRSPGFQLYFLPYLFVVSIGVCALHRLSQRHHQWAHWVTLTLVVTLYLVRGYPEVSHGPAYRNLPLYLAAFLAGNIGRPFFERQVTNAWVVAATLGVVLVILMLSRLPVVSLAVPPLLVSLARNIPRVCRSKLLLLMGTMSGSIYVWHTPLILPFFTRLLAYCGIPSMLNFFGSIVLTTVICIVLRIGFDSFCMRLINRNAPRCITL